MEERNDNNVAFKCNYCDGGKDENGIGFAGPCMFDTNNRERNISFKVKDWCSNKRGVCSKYWNKEISKEELLESYENGHCCYESYLLSDWTFTVGQFKNGMSKCIRNAKERKVALFTTVFPGEPEENRCIFAAFVIDELFEGDINNPGFVSSKYKETGVSFTEEEARKLKFWDFYRNPNSPTSLKWGSGLFRYLSDAAVLRILRAAIDVVENDDKKKAIKDIIAHSTCR